MHDTINQCSAFTHLFFLGMVFCRNMVVMLNTRFVLKKRAICPRYHSYSLIFRYSFHLSGITQ